MFWKKKTQEEKMAKRVSNVLAELTSDIESSFTELEQVQILNEVRRLFAEHLSNSKNENISKSVDFQQKAKEIQNAIEYLE